MIYPIWRLSEDRADNLGLAVTADGLLLGRIPLVERLLPGLRLVASALNANDQAGARIAAVHLRIPDLPSLATRDAMIAEDALIKYERGDWDPDLHPRAGTAPNPGWFATTQGQQQDANQNDPSDSQSRLRIAANEDGSRRTDAPSPVAEQKAPQPGNPIDEPANLTDRPEWINFWSNIWPSVRDWLEERVPQYDLESGRVVGDRPRWQALAPYFGITAATAALLGTTAFAPTVAAWFGLDAPEATIIANAERGAASEA